MAESNQEREIKTSESYREEVAIESNQEREAKIFEIYRSEGAFARRSDAFARRSDAFARRSDAFARRSDDVNIIAGPDDRKDYFQVTSDSLLKKLANATVILANRNSVTRQVDGTYMLDVSPFRVSGLSPCSGERFSSQNTGGWCSGFMVESDRSDIIVTAGHCAKGEAEVRNTAYIFGFRVSSSGEPGTTVFRADQVYFGKDLIAQRDSEGGDFAIVRVDRKITAPGAAPLKVRKTGKISVDQKVGVVGYPSGLPVKIAFGDKTVVKRNEDQEPWFFANLDTYKSNSGSPVFNTDGLVEGILVGGNTDYDLSEGGSCFVSIRISDDKGSERVTKATVFASEIPS